MTKENISKPGNLVPRLGKEIQSELYKTNHLKAALEGAALTVVTLFGGLLLGLTLGVVIFHNLPGHSLENPSPAHTAIASFPALLGFLAGARPGECR